MIIDYLIILFLVGILIWSFWTLFRIIKYKTIVTELIKRKPNLYRYVKDYDTIVQYPWRKINLKSILDRTHERLYIHPYNEVNKLINSLFLKDFIVEKCNDEYGEYFSYTIWVENDIHVNFVVEGRTDIKQSVIFCIYIKNELILSDELPLCEMVESLRRVVERISSKKLG